MMLLQMSEIICLMIPTILRILMIWIFSCAITMVIIVPVYVTKTITMIIIVAVVMTIRMIGIPVAILNHTVISLTSRTSMT